MKTKSLFILLFAMNIFLVHGQSDYSYYLNKALEKLEAGECESAQKLYNVYKDLSGETKRSIEVLIQDCIDEKRSNQDKTYEVGGTIMVDNVEYKVAYVRDSGKHGLAVLDKGWNSISSYGPTECVTRKGIPTYEELKLIYQNRDLIGLYDKYWTCTINVKSKSYSKSSPEVGPYIVMDFSTGAEFEVPYKYHGAVILLIYRF